MKKVLLVAVLGLAGCSGDRLSPGTEVVTHWKGEQQVYGTRPDNGDLCYLPMGTLMRVASDEDKKEGEHRNVQVIALEGQYQGKTILITRHMITPR